jgi:hypothetical protein
MGSSLNDYLFTALMEPSVEADRRKPVQNMQIHYLIYERGARYFEVLVCNLTTLYGTVFI